MRMPAGRLADDVIGAPVMPPVETVAGHPVRRLLSASKFARVYLCDGDAARKRLAVKVFSPLPADETGRLAGYPTAVWRERFLRERAALAAIDHPNVIPVIEQGRLPDGAPYYAMPYVASKLRNEIGADVGDPRVADRLAPPRRPKRLPVDRAVLLLGGILDGLAALHARNVVHRDLKPDNVLLPRRGSPRPLLCDLGMAKLPDARLSNTGVWIGTLNYMSPEQKRSATGVDARADVYAAAAVTYRMLTGMLAEGAFPSLAECGVDAAPGLEKLLRDALSPDPAGRPADAAAMRRRLAELEPKSGL